MALTDQEKARLRVVWRRLADLARGKSDSEEFRRSALDSTNWLSPLEHQADAYVLFAFARLCVACVRSRVADLGRRAPVLAAVATEVEHLLSDDSRQPGPPPPPRLPFRADIDG